MRMFGKLITYSALVLGGIIFVFPFYWMLLSSGRALSELFSFPPNLLPIKWGFMNFRQLLTTTTFLRSFLNSVVVSTSYTALAVLLCSMAGFGFAKYAVPGREVLFYFLLASMMLPGQVTLVPLFILMEKIGWVNSFQSIILPGVANAFGIYWFRQYISTIPNELLDAAKMDGCSHFQIYWRVILPVSRPALAVLGILLFMGAWNDFLWPLIILKTQDMFTIPLVLAQLRELSYIPYHLIMAGSVLATLPLLVIFFILQRQFISGMLEGFLK